MDGGHFIHPQPDRHVTARPMLPVTRLADVLCESVDASALFFVGDCVIPRTALEAIHEAAVLGHRL